MAKVKPDPAVPPGAPLEGPSNEDLMNQLNANASEDPPLPPELLDPPQDNEEEEEEEEEEKEGKEHSAVTTYPSQADIDNERLEVMRQISPRRPNQAGVTYNPESDDCFHLNAGWRHGCCTVQQNGPCAFLGGNQTQCPLYEQKEVVELEIQSTPRKRRKFGTQEQRVP